MRCSQQDPDLCFAGRSSPRAWQLLLPMLLQPSLPAWPDQTLSLQEAPAVPKTAAELTVQCCNRHPSSPSEPPSQAAAMLSE